ELTISSEYDSEFVSIKVKDTGSGIPEENRDKVFLPFFTTKNIDEGTGLGLPVVHGIVKAHEGMIDFKSCKKRGTEFTVKLPIKDKEVKDGK
ncbi:MAG: HAMP domain-containing sensor histidine kinase, partial [candidate division WOR-3 bacterium]|nr:HAMP domain-containing sensor histidine kinase [candidate division WOR-3 bacterium]